MDSEVLSQYMRGTLHVLVLRTLRGEELHGYAIAARIEERAGGVLRIEDGALYQALHRLEEHGWVESAWGHAESGLTPAGRRRLETEAAGWARFARAVFAVLEPA
jgi:DNA-binding PadR family transcriptional regulator